MTKTARDIVVFDLGGVLIDWDPRHLYRKLFAGNRSRPRNSQRIRGVLKALSSARISTEPGIISSKRVQ